MSGFLRTRNQCSSIITRPMKFRSTFSVLFAIAARRGGSRSGRDVVDKEQRSPAAPGIPVRQARLRGYRERAEAHAHYVLLRLDR